MSHSLTILTRTIAATVNPKRMELKDIDRLHNAVSRVISDRPTHIDITALERLATELDNHRKQRRLNHTGHIAGQVDIYGNETAA